MQSLGFESISLDEIKALLRMMKKKVNERIEFRVFKRIVDVRMLSRRVSSDYRYIFNLFDLDHQGGITLENLKELKHRLSEPIPETTLHDMITEIDRDGDGKVSYDDFISIIEKMESK